MSTNQPPRSRPLSPHDTPPQQSRSSRPSRRPDAQARGGQRQGQAQGQGQGQSTRRTLRQLPPYQPQVGPFNASTVQKLSQLSNFPRLAVLRTRLTKAAEALTECAGMINDRLADAKVRETRTAGLKRKAVDVEGEGEGEVEGEVEGGGGQGEEEDSGIAVMEERVKDLTGQLEEKMRKIVDAEVRTMSLTDGLQRIHREAVAAAPAAPQAKRRRMRRRPGEDEEEDEEGVDEDEEQSSVEESLPIRNGGTCKALRKELKEKKGQWKETSLTDRYTKNNKYIGFYRIVHESKHPGDEIPPLPHPSTWFANTEPPPTTTGAATTANTATAVDADADDSDDLAIHSERLSLRCPITLLPFNDPVKSRKCPHSFERATIVAMIERSKERVAIPAASGGAGRRVKCVKCPVCSVLISVHDLEMDVVAVRRLRRAEERRRREDEEDGEDLEGEDVDDADDDDDEKEVVMGRVRRSGKGKGGPNVKTERERVRERQESRELSVVPDTQMANLD